MLGIATSDESATYCIPTGGKKRLLHTIKMYNDEVLPYACKDP